jgi:hypothetical protein
MTVRSKYLTVAGIAGASALALGGAIVSPALAASHDIT